MSTMYVNQIAPLQGDTISVASGNTFHAPGHVIQVVQTQFITATTYSNTGAWNDITPLSINITPSSSTSKVLLVMQVSFSTSSAGCGHLIGLKVNGSLSSNARSYNGSQADGWFGLDNNNDQANGAYNVNNSHASFLDSPNTTSQITYLPSLYITSGASPIKFNQSNSGHFGAISTFTAMEIAG